MNGAQLHYEEYGTGDPMLCIHGTGSAGFVWDDAARKLATLGRAIVYDRRGFTRSTRPSPSNVTEVAEHTEDAKALLQALDAEPAVLLGRSYGGSVALDLALTYPESVRALVLLEAVPFGLSEEMDAFGERLIETLERVAAERGIEAVGETMLREVLGEWDSLPPALRDLFTTNSAAILAETRGGELTVDATQLSAIRAPTLVVSAASSPEGFRAASTALAQAVPGARHAQVGGGHLVDPAGPEVLAFVSEVFAERVPA